MRRNSVKERGRRHGDRWRELSLKQIRESGSSPGGYDHDTAMFISVAQELKEEGTKLFMKRDYEGALIKYEKSIKLLPNKHADIAYVRTNMAECYMQLGKSEYPGAIHECSMALEVTPNYSKALLKRARCYETLDRPDLALRDVRMVLKDEPNNLMATEIEQRLKKTFERQGSRFHELPFDVVPPLPETNEPSCSSSSQQSQGPVIGRANTQKYTEKSLDYNEDDASSTNRNGAKGVLDKQMSCTAAVSLRMANDTPEEKSAEDKLVVEEKISNGAEEEPKRTMKLVFGEDIRWAQVPLNCDIFKLRQIVSDRFPNAKAVLMKYTDSEGDLVTITTTEELRWAESSTKQGSVKLYVVEVSPEEDPLYEKLKKRKRELKLSLDDDNEGRLKEVRSEQTCITDWIIQFAHFFKNYVGFDIDAYIDLHQVGIKLYSEAMEETITSQDAQELLGVAADKFVEMATLALFNCGNVHMSRARKKVYITDDFSRETVLEKINSSYDWAQKEFAKAGKRYEEGLKIKPNFYEAVLALGQQQFEQAKLSWYYAIATGVDLETWPSGDVLMLYNSAEENMERGMQLWEDQQQQRLRDLSKTNKIESLLQKMKLENLFKEVSADEIEEQASNIRSQIFVLWGTILYERSMMEFKLGVPVWHECLEAAVEKFEHAGASGTDIAVMVKNHCSNDTSLEGLGFNIDEIVQAWDEMYEAKKWQHNIPTFRLEPLLRRRISKLYYALERL